jgi:hypothetical protein
MIEALKESLLDIYICGGVCGGAEAGAGGGERTYACLLREREIHTHTHTHTHTYRQGR